MWKILTKRGILKDQIKIIHLKAELKVKNNSKQQQQRHLSLKTQKVFDDNFSMWLCN